MVVTLTAPPIAKVDETSRLITSATDFLHLAEQFLNTKKNMWDHLVLVPPALELSAPWIGRHYEERPEVEQDDQQLKSGGWLVQQLTTRYSEMASYVVTVVLSYSL